MDAIDLLEKAHLLPELPGCYLMKGLSASGIERILYVGKAKNLKKRVQSYFQKGAKGHKTEILVRQIVDFEFMTAQSEAEALILENNLIKKHGPKYNILLRDDKSYPYLSIDQGHPFPRICYERNPKRSNKKLIFGPYATGSRVSELLSILNKACLLRSCPDSEFFKRKTPCLLFQMRHCEAPCMQLVSGEHYNRQLSMVISYLKGKPDELLENLTSKMEALSEKEEFEAAMVVRDQLVALSEFINKEQQKNAEFLKEAVNLDAIAFYRGQHEGDEILDMAIYIVRNGILIGSKNFNFVNPTDSDSLFVELIYQYYSGSSDLPPESVVVDLDEESQQLLSEALTDTSVRGAGRKYRSLLDLVTEQAKNQQEFRIKTKEGTDFALKSLKELLLLKEVPYLIECYDVAIFQGSSPTASQIVYHGGRALKDRYRHYTLTERPEGNNDFAMMEELMGRRLSSSNNDLPDLIIVDGGKGQVSSLLAILQERGVSIPVIGIAKERHLGEKQSYERLIIPGRLNPYELSKNRALMRLVTSMRDEAHRFSRRLHHKHEVERVITSWVQEVKGLTKESQKMVLENAQQTKDELKSFTKEELANIFPLKKGQLEKLYAYLHS